MSTQGPEGDAFRAFFVWVVAVAQSARAPECDSGGMGSRPIGRPCTEGFDRQEVLAGSNATFVFGDGDIAGQVRRLIREDENHA